MVAPSDSTQRARLDLTRAPVLFLGWGNPSRGDDALGPLLCDRLEALLAEQGQLAARVEVQQDFQLQVEDAMDVADRALVVFIDASISVAPPYSLNPVVPKDDASPGSHALSPAAVLSTTCKIMGAAPPAVLLAVRGETFELGAPLSALATENLEAAWALLRRIAVADDPAALGQRLADSSGA